MAVGRGRFGAGEGLVWKVKGRSRSGRGAGSAAAVHTTSKPPSQAGQPCMGASWICASDIAGANLRSPMGWLERYPFPLGKKLCAWEWGWWLHNPHDCTAARDQRGSFYLPKSMAASRGCWASPTIRIGKNCDLLPGSGVIMATTLSHSSHPLKVQEEGLQG